MTADLWHGLRRDIEAAVSAMSEGESFIVAEPDPPAPASRRRRWFGGREPGPVGRYVQCLDVGEHVVLECIGPGYTDITGEQDAAIRGLGFAGPQEQPGSSQENYRVDLPRDATERVARLGADALAALGVSADTDWQWTHHPV